MHTVIIGLGSNIEAQKNIQTALAELGKHFKILEKTPVKRTQPVGPTNQPDFLNSAVLAETDKDCTEIKSVLRTIEDLLKRDRSGHPYGPRTIDLDILVWNDRIVDQDFYNRDFIREDVMRLKPDLKY